MFHNTPKWRAPKTVWGTSTNRMLADFRIDALTANKSGFTHQGPFETKPLLFNLSWKNVTLPLIIDNHGQDPAQGGSADFIGGIA